MLLKKAVEWDVIERLPCAIRLLPIPKGSAGFYDFDDYERLVAAAKANDRDAYLAVLVGGEAGSRCGEIMALEWGDVDLNKRQLCVQRSDWKGHVTATKGGRLRYLAPNGIMMAVAVDPGQAFHVGTPTPLFQTPSGTIVGDVTADGKRFLLIAPVGPSASVPFTVVLNWTAGLKK